MGSTPAQVTGRQLVPFAALSATYFAHIGFFNPYLPLWLKDLGLPIVVISLLTSVQSFTRVFAPYAWGALSDHTGERVRHYGMTDPMEYFAEGTEAFLYRNDFYPFVRAELKLHDPTLHDVLARVWAGGQ